MNGSWLLARYGGCIVLGWLLSQEALAWRCNGRLIEAGQTLYEVRERCREPDSVERRETWRLQTYFQQQCRSLPEPRTGDSGDGRGRPAAPRSRLVCSTIPFSYSVPVDEEIWYFEDGRVPKALHFENGRLIQIEALWQLRQ